MAFLDLFKKSSKGHKEKTSVSEITGAYDKDIAKNKVVIFLLPKHSYQDELLGITKSAAKMFDRILYVSLNKPVEKIAENFKESGIDTEKFLFIDATFKEGKPDIAYHNIVFVNFPKEFESFDSGLNKILDDEKFECVIFDSLSTLLIYQEQNTIIRFVHDLIKKLAVANAAGLFSCLKEDVDSVLVKDIAMFVDKVIEAGKEEKEKMQEYGKEEATIKLEKEFESIKQAFESKLISEQSYLHRKKAIEEKLEKLMK